ncbi:hypothetical protein D3C73_1670040 [compost metagenome]
MRSSTFSAGLTEAPAVADAVPAGADDEGAVVEELLLPPHAVATVANMATAVINQPFFIFLFPL